jgi:hypothetical protein
MLSENIPLRELLEQYQRVREQSPDREWHDRVMEMEGAGRSELSKLHGLLLANGWIDARVHADAFQSPSGVLDCYRVTPEGTRLLKTCKLYNEPDASADPW